MRSAVCALLCAPLLSVLSAAASPKVVETFDAKTWARLQQDLPRPAAVVFTATYCANCPQIIERLTETLRNRGLQQQVIAVVIDAASDQELLSSGHYKSAARLFAFDGDEAALRHGVDPRWRGVTPYVALLSEQNKVVFVAGAPSDAQIIEWSATNGSAPGH
jgi:hypothetical protein